jgi:hypothetical protein
MDERVGRSRIGVAAELRRIAIAVGGGSVLCLGIALLVVPVPGTALVVIPLGIAILAREFVWARRLRDWLKRATRAMWTAVRRAGGRPAVPVVAR